MRGMQARRAMTHSGRASACPTVCGCRPGAAAKRAAAQQDTKLPICGHYTTPGRMPSKNAAAGLYSLIYSGIMNIKDRMAFEYVVPATPALPPDRGVDGMCARGRLRRAKERMRMLDIKLTRTTSPKAKPADESKLGFGKIFTDHMFLMDYTAGEGWHDARIVPYAPLPLDPATVVLHYAQEIFEGMKAYRTADGTVQLFRPDCNATRFQDSADRLCIPRIPAEDFVQAVEALVDVDRDWVPHSDGASLYIRPFCFANDVGLGVHASKHYIFCIICSPSGAYYAEGLDPVRIYVEDEYIRAAPGLTGFTKCGGNYAASIKAGELAEEQGFSQVLWLDGVEKKYVEEVGSMNIMFKIDGKVYTAACTGTVLPGVTRRSIIELLRDWGYEVVEGKLAIADVMQAARDGKLEEVFGTGTAAVVSPVKELDWKGEQALIGDGQIGPLTQKLYDTLTGIQWGKLPDEKGWTVPVKQMF